MKKLHSILLLTFLLIFIVLEGCKKEENKEFTDSPVIESYLEPGSYLTVNISRQIPFSDNVKYSSDDINHLAITVTGNNATHVLLPLGNGKYIDSSITVSDGINFNLSFMYNSKKVTAYTYIPYKPHSFSQSASEIFIKRRTATSGSTFGPGNVQPTPITFNWNNSDNSYYLMLVENIEATLDPIRDFGSSSPPSNRFRKSPTNLSTVDLRSFDFTYYGTHRIILYHVLPDYATLYTANSTSSQNLTNPSTSIVNGYGIFTGLNADTLFVEVKEQF